MRTGLANLAWLAADDPAGARRVVTEAMASWSQQGFYLQHYFELLALAQIDLYEGEGARALERIHAAWPDMRRAQLFRVEYIRCLMFHLRGRAAIAAGALDEAAGSARRLEAVGDHARCRALLLRAAIAEKKGDRAGALKALRSARARFDAAGVRGYQFAVHHVEARPRRRSRARRRRRCLFRGRARAQSGELRAHDGARTVAFAIQRRGRAASRTIHPSPRIARAAAPAGWHIACKRSRA